MKRILVYAALAALGAASIKAQNPAIIPEFYFTDNNGLPLAGGKLCTYVAGTTTPQATYTNSSGTPNANPIILDSAGRASIWMGAASYKFVLLTPGSDGTCSTGSTLWTQDNVNLNPPSPPFSTALTIQKDASDATKQFKFDISGFTTGTTRTIGVQNANYTLAGTNTPQVMSAVNTFTAANIFTTNQVFQAQIQFYNGGSGPQWSLASDVNNMLKFYNSSSTLRAYLQDNGVGPVVGSTGAWMFAPSLELQSSANNTPSLTVLQKVGQTADLVDVFDSAVAQHFLQLNTNGMQMIGTTVGTVYPFKIFDIGLSPGISLYRSESGDIGTYSGGWSAGATAALGVNDASNNHPFTVCQNDYVLVGTSDCAGGGGGGTILAAGGLAVHISGTTLPLFVQNDSTNSSGLAATFSCNAASTGSSCVGFTTGANITTGAWPIAIRSPNAVFDAGTGVPTKACSFTACYWFRIDGGAGTMIYSYYGGAWHAGL